MTRVLIVDDEQSICWGLAQLVQEMGYEGLTAASAEEGFEVARQTPPDTIVLDVRLPGMDGLEAMEKFRQIVGPVPIIVMTAHGDLATAVTAVRNGASDYVTKPFDLRSAEKAIERALAGGQAAVQNISSPDGVEEGQIVGVSSAMQEVFKRIALVAASEACVHLYGESGTGKELAARAVHRHSRRAEGPFVAVNVASLSPSLVESELFGHVRGAFTGAEETRKGLLEQADGGVIFLDEVADIPLTSQVKLLRALEQGEVLPVGATRPVHADFRVISATHQTLPELVSRGRFRHDLYFRLVAFEIEIPPLRERRQDIPLLAERFLNLIAAKQRQTLSSISADAMAELERMPWYGNARELRNAIEYATVLARNGTITPEHLPPPAPANLTAAAIGEDALTALIRKWTAAQLDASPDVGDLYDRFLRLVEPPMLRAVLAHSHGQCATAARHLGLHRTTLRKKLKRYAID